MYSCLSLGADCHVVAAERCTELVLRCKRRNIKPSESVWNGLRERGGLLEQEEHISREALKANPELELNSAGYIPVSVRVGGWAMVQDNCSNRRLS